MWPKEEEEKRDKPRILEQMTGKCRLECPGEMTNHDSKIEKKIIICEAVFDITVVFCIITLMSVVLFYLASEKTMTNSSGLILGRQNVSRRS